ncbi:MAG: TerB N-terminal domain-containing protein [Candidatus Omnitrophota bacterium]|nr:TerB N-terminal domain-containing protein [Candidatus Omnitrophota bacterium]
MSTIIFLIVVWAFWQILKPKAQNSSDSLQRKSTDYQPKYQPTSVSPDSVWVPSGEERIISGYTIKGGLIYFGTGLLSVRAWNKEPALIDPTLPVDKSTNDWDGRQINYWPSYSNISATARNAYLEWLANGRNNPTVNIGYVFLYFYGLERRILVDIRESSKAALEKEIILTELKRLREIYRSNYSFNQYSSNLIDYLEIIDSKYKLYSSPIDVEGFVGYEFPLKLRVGLAQIAADGNPLSPDWALAWVKSDPENRLRTPAHRCKEEFQKLFYLNYKEKFGEGLLLVPNKTKLRVNYRPASQTFTGAIEASSSELYDVSMLKEPLNKLRKIADMCIDQLDAYSRYLGRNPDKYNLLVAWALLPDKIIISSQSKDLQMLSVWLKDNLGTSKILQTDLSTVWNQIPSINQKEIGKQEVLALSQLLSKMGVGIEPDLRFGSPLVTSGAMVLFNLPPDFPLAPSLEYSVATTVLRLTTAVSAADGNISQDEKEYLERKLEMLFNLSQAEKVRLKAYTQYLLLAPSNFSGIKKQLQAFDLKQRENIGKFLVGIAQADGFIDPNEIQILNKIFSILDLDVQNLYSQAHAAATEPVKIESGDVLQKGFTIPSEFKKRRGVKVELDMVEIERKIAETAEVTAMLNNIFSAEDSVGAQSIPEPADEDGIMGLGPENSRFVRLLVAKSIWTRGELEQLAAKQNLLLDGVLDTINDSSFRSFDEPFFEGTDEIELNDKIVKEILK